MRHAASATAGVTGAVLLGLGLFGQPAVYVAALRSEWAVLMDWPSAPQAAQPAGALTEGTAPPSARSTALLVKAPGTNSPTRITDNAQPGTPPLPGIRDEPRRGGGTAAALPPEAASVSRVRVTAQANASAVALPVGPAAGRQARAAVASRATPMVMPLPEATQPYLLPFSAAAGPTPRTQAPSPQAAVPLPRSRPDRSTWQRQVAAAAEAPVRDRVRSADAVRERAGWRDQPRPVRQAVIPPSLAVARGQPRPVDGTPAKDVSANGVARAAVLAKLRDARWALEHGSVMRAQSLLEEAQLRLVFQPGDGDGAASGRGAALIARALAALGEGRRGVGRRYIAGAAATLAGAGGRVPLPDSSGSAAAGFHGGGYAPAYPSR